MRYFLLRGAVIPKAFQLRSWLSLQVSAGGVALSCLTASWPPRKLCGAVLRSGTSWAPPAGQQEGVGMCLLFRWKLLSNETASSCILNAFSFFSTNKQAVLTVVRTLHSGSVCEAQSHLALIFLGSRFVLVAHNVQAQWVRVKKQEYQPFFRSWEQSLDSFSTTLSLSPWCGNICYASFRGIHSF